MKRLITGLAIAAIALGTSGTAYAQCVGDPLVCTWRGDCCDDWTCINMNRPRDNWGNNRPGNYPGKEQPGDSAIIGDPSEPTINLDRSLYELDTLTLSADDANASMTLNILSTGGLATTGLVTVKGRQSGELADNPATLSVVGDLDFAPNTLLAHGRSDGVDLSHAVLDFNGDVTVVENCETATSFQGYCDVKLAPGVLFDAQEVYLVAGSDVTVSKTDQDPDPPLGGTLQVTTLTVDNATLRVSNATIQTTD